MNDGRSDIVRELARSAEDDDDDEDDDEAAAAEGIDEDDTGCECAADCGRMDRVRGAEADEADDGFALAASWARKLMDAVRDAADGPLADEDDEVDAANDDEDAMPRAGVMDTWRLADGCRCCEAIDR